MRYVPVGSLVIVLALVGCDDDFIVGMDAPPAPRDVEANYYAGVVTVSWGLALAWNGETFGVYSRRVTDAEDHYGVIRPHLLGYDQDDNALMIFGWAYQVQAENPDLVRVGGAVPSRWGGKVA